MNIDYSRIEKQEAAPVAGSMIETLRAIGYTLGTALADIIDNSISASAKHIWVERLWNGDQSYIYIKDDGQGMNGARLIEAMRPGSQNPLEERSATDLGRFGLGLKTASFSQCRCLSVMSKSKGYKETYWSWDLDYVKKSGNWQLIKWFPEEFLSGLDNQESGTIVFWSNLDRVIPQGTQKEDEKSHQKFSEMWQDVKQHIAMTFHRFIEDKSIKIYFGNEAIEPWNPFCTREIGTQPQPEESILINGKEIVVKGYVLPHEKNFSSEEAYKRAGGRLGYPALQGFYVYRGKRLLLSGTWLGLFRKEEHVKLVRIMVDLPNTLDSEWQIDIKKSSAILPPGCRDQLKVYAMGIRKIGIEVFRHRGKILKQRAGTNFQPLWLPHTKDNKWKFVISRDHQIVKDAIEFAKVNPEKAINNLLVFIEETIPTKTIFIKQCENEDKEEEPMIDVDTSIISDIISRIFNNKIAEGYSEQQAKEILKTIEPLNNYEEIINRQTAQI